MTFTINIQPAPAAGRPTPTTPAGKKKVWYPKGKLRAVLAAWPAGQIRKSDKLYRNFPGVTREAVGHAIARGYLEEIRVPPPKPGSPKHEILDWAVALSGRHTRLKRTDKRCKPSKPRGPRADYQGLFPWSVSEHWRRVQESSAYAARDVVKRIQGKPRLNFGEELAMPRLFYRRRDLDMARALVTALFDGEDPTRTAKKTARLRTWLQLERVDSWVPRELYHLLYAGAHGLQLLLLELLVEPEFGPDGQLVKFRALDPDIAAERATVVRGDGATPLDRYRAHYAPTTTHPLPLDPSHGHHRAEESRT